MGKEEIARHEQFLLFPQCFLLNKKLVSPFVIIQDIISLFAAELEEPKNGIWGEALPREILLGKRYDCYRNYQKALVCKKYFVVKFEVEMVNDIN